MINVMFSVYKKTWINEPQAHDKWIHPFQVDALVWSTDSDNPDVETASNI